MLTLALSCPNCYTSTTSKREGRQSFSATIALLHLLFRNYFLRTRKQKENIIYGSTKTPKTTG